jgi:hypothetical protein
MHEVGHYLMCPLEYKHHIDYGLGPGGTYNIEACRSDVDEDILASIFGIYMEFLIGVDIGVIIGDVGVDKKLKRKFLNKCFSYYCKLGIIDEYGNPVNVYEKSRVGVIAF